FKGVALTGYTIRAPFAQIRRGIAAADILLRDADAFLRAQRLGRSGEVFLFDAENRIIAHPRMSDLLRARSGGDGRPSAPRAARVGRYRLAVGDLGEGRQRAADLRGLGRANLRRGLPLDRGRGRGEAPPRGDRAAGRVL